MKWYLYLVECKDNSLYTGITTDIKRRISEHNAGKLKGSKYTRSKRPVQLVYLEVYNNQSEAKIREAAIKNWTRDNKLKLINKNKPLGFTP